MTVEDVEKRVVEIRQRAWDDEAAHSDEDSLRDDVLQTIADGAENARALALAVLETSKIDFSRWCA
jgi:hypothetical protein